MTSTPTARQLYDASYVPQATAAGVKVKAFSSFKNRAELLNAIDSLPKPKVTKASTGKRGRAPKDRQIDTSGGASKITQSLTPAQRRQLRAYCKANNIQHPHNGRWALDTLPTTLIKVLGLKGALA
jgi:hypothetical protein